MQTFFRTHFHRGGKNEALNLQLNILEQFQYFPDEVPHQSVEAEFLRDYQIEIFRFSAAKPTAENNQQIPCRLHSIFHMQPEKDKPKYHRVKTETSMP